MRSLRFLFKHLTGILFGVWCIVAFQIFQWFPLIVESVYFNFIFRAIRLFWDYTIGFLPIPSIYILLGLLIFGIVKWMQKTKSEGILNAVLRLLNFAGYVITAFYILWGFNYARLSLAERQNWKHSNISQEWLFGELEEIHLEAQNARLQLASYPDSILLSDIPVDLETDIRSQLETIFSNFDLNTTGRVRVRKLYPKGVLLRISTAGVYIPFVSEGHIDPGLHPISWPFTIAHEMSHGYGITSEGECNFLAYLICQNSNNAFTNYSGSIGYLRYLLVSARSVNKERFNDFMRCMDSVIKEDLKAIYNASARYPDILPKFRNLIYDNYLKSQGIAEGMVSYSRIIRLMHAYKSASGFKSQMN